MFGALRLILALMVALSHAGVSWAGYHLGVPAVVVFLLLSGYVVAAMLQPRPPWARFWAERAVRLLPPYYTAWLAGVLLWWLGVDSPFLQGAHQPGLWLAGLLVIPLNYATLWPALDTFTPVPPAWSLGLEIQFYLLAPWLLAAPRRLWGATILTAGVGALAQLGALPSDALGYRLLVGNLYIFLSGAMLWHAGQGSVPHRRALMALWLWVALIGAVTGAMGRWGQPFVLEVTAGYLVGLPLVAALARRPRTMWDDRLADLAYPLFLIHFAVLWGLQLAGHPPSPTAPAFLLRYVLLALAAAWLVHRVAQRPWRGLRHRLRYPPPIR